MRFSRLMVGTGHIYIYISETKHFSTMVHRWKNASKRPLNPLKNQQLKKKNRKKKLSLFEGGVNFFLDSECFETYGKPLFSFFRGGGSVCPQWGNSLQLLPLHYSSARHQKLFWDGILRTKFFCWLPVDGILFIAWVPVGYVFCKPAIHSKLLVF